MSEVGSKQLFPSHYLPASVAEWRKVKLVSAFLPLAHISGSLGWRFLEHKSATTPGVFRPAELTHVALIRSLD